MTTIELGETTVRAIAKSIWGYFWLGIAIAFVIVEIVDAASSAMGVGFDDTDGTSRSGMVVKTDCRTGLQYLATPDGGLTPRLDASGAHISEPCK
jgi:hypothetical protein